jgi:hypothetical protein
MAEECGVMTNNAKDCRHPGRRARLSALDLKENDK